MSDYTPTTEEVYRAHWRGTPMRSENGLREYVALDRWLAEVKAQAWKEGFTHGSNSPVSGQTTDNPYRQGETE